MRKIIALLLLGLVILTACVIPVKPVFAASAIENFWTTKAPMYQARSALGVVAVDGKIYAIEVLHQGVVLSRMLLEQTNNIILLQMSGFTRHRCLLQEHTSL